MWSAYALRALGLLFATTAVLVLMGGLVQINPIWQWGPYHPYLSENGAQPDWYIGWLIGALRLMPNWELVIGGHTIIPEPFWGGVAFPAFVFGVLFSWPALERRITGDQRRHDLLDRPRDHPTRTAIGAAFFSWVFFIFAAGSLDRIFFRLHFSYVGQVHFWRAAIWIVPVIVYFVVRAWARALSRSRMHPLRGWQGEIVRHDRWGAVIGVDIGDDGPDPEPSEPPTGSPPAE
jgi:ubiquinol-cytochrome c reductase cytochrome b subunit